MGSCVHFPGDQKVEHEQPCVVHAWTEASKPGLPPLPAGDGTVHDAGHEDTVDLSNADWDCQEIRLREEGLRASGHRLPRSDAQAFPVDIEPHHEKTPLRQCD
jgi:hypothetical protein